MFIRNAFIASLLGIFGYASTACANSCANVTMAGSLFNELEESQFGIYAAGTFRIEGEEDEGKQPMFNLAKINCEKQFDDRGRVSIECKVAEAIVSAFADKPDTNNPNCSLDLDAFTYSMKELEKGVLAGMDESGTCYNTVLTIDKNAKRVYRSFTRTTASLTSAARFLAHRH